MKHERICKQTEAVIEDGKIVDYSAIKICQFIVRFLESHKQELINDFFYAGVWLDIAVFEAKKSLLHKCSDCRVTHVFAVDLMVMMLEELGIYPSTKFTVNSCDDAIKLLRKRSEKVEVQLVAKRKMDLAQKMAMLN